ncbi:hypothetical protein BI364_04850 [Acidihalobacter yilgarnensis]|uniref:Hydrogenase maturation protease n=1 Tax=Acidihalobacter yilgarnensis TaxID=2819280 RepID=A0A1D8ILS8_9GAMM|nr:hypothetical protein [Acidihalobacter yilgarnensis]AOU97403.1 hypothetical protein BI364_04850 [Acidihalobacter yilgarnensis]
MRRLAVIGIGSPFGGDRIAWTVIERLRSRPLDAGYSSGGMILEACDRPGPNLIEQLRGLEHAILIDAVMGATVPAAWYDEASFVRMAAPLSGHAIGLAETLALGRALGDLPTIDLLGLCLTSDTQVEAQICTSALRLLRPHLRALSTAKRPCGFPDVVPRLV